MYHVYILQSTKDGRTYAGYTKNLSQRLKQHNAGQVPATKHRRPLQLLIAEEFRKNREAQNREQWWKSGAGRRKLAEFFREGCPVGRPDCKYATWADPRKPKKLDGKVEKSG